MLLCQGGRCRQPQHAGHYRWDHQTIAIIDVIIKTLQKYHHRRVHQM